MANTIFTKSDKFKEEYCVGIVRIEKLDPIEGSDFLVKATVAGFPIVVRKDEFNVGDVALYAMNETELNEGFLSKNNLYEIGEREKNSNFEFVNGLYSEGKVDEAKKHVGFFNKWGRVKMIRLRGCPSMGFIFGLDALAKWKPSLANINLEEHVGEFFDTINGELFVKMYMPHVQPTQTRRSKSEKRQNKVARFNRMISGQFYFHYDTNQLNVNMWRLQPDTKVVISNKIHGTSFILGKVLVKKPKALTVGQQVVNKKLKHMIKKIRSVRHTRYHDKYKTITDIERLRNKILQEYTIGYGNVYSSRTVIKNQYINRKVTRGYYNVDVWGEYYNLLKDYIPEGLTIYGEIYGYLTGSQSMIQKGYDYGCPVGTNKLMIYRISKLKEDGTRLELNVKDVYNWTVTLIKKHPELKKFVHPIDIFYNGTLGDLYPEIPVSEHWNANVLEAMKNDKEHFGMEMPEPMCKSKMPREGIVVRIDDDPVLEAFKLKCVKFLEKERDNYDKGEIGIEAEETI